MSVVEFLQKKLVDFSCRLFQNNSHIGCLTDLWMHLLCQLWCSFIINVIIFFSYFEPCSASRMEFFTEMIGRFQSLTISERKIHQRYLTDFWMYFFIQLWCSFIISIIIHFSFIYFAILSFGFFTVTQFNCFKRDFLCYHLNILSDVVSFYCIFWTFFSIFY